MRSIQPSKSWNSTSLLAIVLRQSVYFLGYLGVTLILYGVVAAPPANAQCPDGFGANITAFGILGEGICEDGKREVSLIAQHNVAGFSPQAHWIRGDTTEGPVFTFAPTILHSEIHSYEPGDYTITLSVEGCFEPEQQRFEPITISPCDGPQRCPAIEFTQVIGECTSGAQSRIITATLTDVAGQPFRAELLADGVVVVAEQEATNGSLQLAHPGLFPSGPHTVTVNVTSPSYCGSSSFSFSVDCSNGDGDSCITCFCGGIWCCILWLFFILSLIATIVTLARALCGVGAWYTFGVSLGLTIAFGVALVIVCDVGVCALLLVMAGSGLASVAVVCNTGIVPANCKSWLCKQTSIAGLPPAANLLIIDVIFTLFALLICAAVNLL